MPALLKFKTQELLKGSQSHFKLGLVGLALPPSSAHSNSWDQCSEIGLIGAAAELSMSAVLVEISKPKILLRKDGMFLSAGEVLSTFTANIKSGIPKLSVLTEGLADPTTHLQDLSKATSSFRTLLKARAGGLHAAGGVTRDVAYAAAKSVTDFYQLLSKSPRWEPYLKDAPVLPTPPREYKLVAEELSQLLASEDKDQIRLALHSVFLILPEIPPEEPPWMKSLVRSYVAPQKNDISILLKALGTAKVGDLIKVKGGTKGIAARIDPDNPNAIPIAYTNLKKDFPHPIEQWRAFVGTANSQLQKNVLGVPKIEFIYELFEIGLDELDFAEEEIKEGLSAHDVWPFIASSLSFSGIPGPCFFLLRKLKATEFDQLKALMEKAAKLAASRAWWRLHERSPRRERLVYS